ncbi:MAG: hypothetical protein HY711_07140, partial [Candidatus Melainabacteria bacterium]|nr:hypothetical protein [Candidatus Melainabacteria bacterium]
AAARRWLNIFDDLDYPRSKTICLVNRSRSAPSTIETQLAHFFGGLQLWKIPNAYKMLQDCLAKGQTAVFKYPRQGYSKAMMKLSQYLGQYIERADDQTSGNTL